uniref:Inorganic pyrophosphatase n=1 Tax=Mucochytrium quahogii TaxID=96639 RepID=A0A7S2RLU3_9STRA|mmetsp:Transcript_18176/g.29512  ORF Transcript_18176/g.29512 Transcript_18176/m.29512 type:complete len:225 (+) Transcript_18176:230-904(+)
MSEQVKDARNPPSSQDVENWLVKSVARKLSIESLPFKLKAPTVFDPYMFPLGAKCPETVPVFIEVSSGSRNKYEWSQEHSCIMLDRVLHSAVHYPSDYGFIPQTLCGDGDPLDVLVMGTQPLIPGCIVNARPIAYMVMEDEKGMDEKVLAVCANDPMFDEVKTFRDLPEHKLREVSHFFETYKGLEKNKWAKVGGWKGTQDTYQLIEQTHSMFIEREQQLENEL